MKQPNRYDQEPLNLDCNLKIKCPVVTHYYWLESVQCDVQFFGKTPTKCLLGYAFAPSKDVSHRGDVAIYTRGSTKINRIQNGPRLVERIWQERRIEEQKKGWRWTTITFPVTPPLISPRRQSEAGSIDICFALSVADVLIKAAAPPVLRFRTKLQALTAAFSPSPHFWWGVSAVRFIPCARLTGKLCPPDQRNTHAKETAIFRPRGRPGGRTHGGGGFVNVERTYLASCAS